MATNQDVVLKIRVFDAQKAFLGGTVDLTFEHMQLSERKEMRAVDASREIAVSGLHRAPKGSYKVFVTRSDPWMQKGQFVSIPSSGIATLEFDFEQRGGGGDGEDDGSYTVQGSVTSPDSAGVGGLRVEIVDKNVGPDVQLAETVTNERGHYSVSFEASAFRKRGKQQPDLQARVYAGEELLASSDIRYNATPQETLNVRLPAGAKALASEHETLTKALARHFDGRLKDLQETEERRDISYLAHKSGWDARAVAMASLSDRLGAQSEIPPAFYYALFRAGLPGDAEALYQADVKTVRGVWKRALEQGVIPRQLEDQLPRAEEAFHSLAAGQALDSLAPAGTSSLKEMLSLTFRDDAQSQQRFADLYTRHRGDQPKFWGAVEESFGLKTTKRLQLDGQLGFLTLHNAPLVERLHQIEGGEPLASTLDLARRGYHRAGKWNELLQDGAIPTEIPGETPAEKRARYAELLAAQVRLSFPTAVVAERIRGGEVRLRAEPEVESGVVDFLTRNQGKFEIGMQPIDRFLARNGAGEQIAEPVKRQIRRLQRIYQLTPSDQAMSALLEDGLDSAYQIVRYDQAEFVALYQEKLGGEQNARLTYAKAQQVHTTVLGIATSFLLARNAPALGLNPDGLVLAPWTGTPEDFSDVIAYPTLENLFGSMDFCACDHCRSILSPAAYLVDLLLFIDRPENEGENPQTVLLERRPDLQHLPLTCENTNTPLPYIDLVNETLEYFITQNLSLAGYTGHDTGADASAAEIMANPQFVNEAAYTVLKDALFPPPLPFHQPLEGLRRYFEKLKVPLPEAMEALREDDDVERPGAAGYGWRDILMEKLRLSRTEYRLLTDRTLTLPQILGFPPATPEATALQELAKVKAFSRRVGITYEEVVELLRTRFVNPHGWLIPRLERLYVPFSTLAALKGGAITDEDFNDLLPEGLDLAPYGGDVVAWVKDDENYSRIMGLIVLSDPTGGEDLCNFDAVEFRYSNPDPATNSLRAIDFVRLLRFFRLWKKLGLTIDQTDQLITALSPPEEPPAGDPLERLDHDLLTLLPRIGIVFQLMDRLKLTPKKDLPALLACWSPLGTHGPASLYRKMFLSPALLRLDAVFADDGFGNFLQDPAQTLLAHAEALRAAFGLTGEELALIVEDLGFDPGTPLDLESLSAVFRRGWLARKLRSSVQELLLLIECTGLDPFAPPDPPDPPIVPLVRLLEALRAASLKPAQALYLIWNQDVSGRSVPEERLITDLARTLRAGLAAIESELAVTGAPDVQLARARMAQVYDAEATDFFFGLLENTLRLEVPYDHTGEMLEPAIVAAGGGRLAFDDFRKRLAWSGTLDAARRDAVKNVPGVSDAFKVAVDTLFAASAAATGPFFARYPELQPLYAAYAASVAPPETRREALLQGLLQSLKPRRKRQQALADVSAALRTDLGLAQAILDDAAVLHAATDPAKPALDDLTALETPGLAGDLVSGIWSGYLEAPENGFYNLEIETEPAAAVTLTLAGQAVALTRDGAVWSNQDPIELTAGTLSRVGITVGAATIRLEVRWRSEGRGREAIPGRHLYSAVLVDRLRSSAIRFLKASSLAAALRMTAQEIVHLATRPEQEIGGQGWLNALPVSGNPDTATSQALLDGLNALLDFARLKARLSPDDDRLLTVLQDPATVLENGDSLLLSLTGWESAALDELLARFGLARGDLARVSAFRRVHEAYAVVTKLGVPVVALLPSITNEPIADTVRNLQTALRARYEESDWLTVIQPINDALRGIQRDALVAHVLWKLRENEASRHIDTADKLFEYFLMDVQMEPCMQTSRIRHALSSVQLFIERCLMNLEPRVAPSSIRARWWEWMKRYRVWEANRKVFLWPENWLEPELRDDQSPIFKETMSELLQSDITEDRAATALLGYVAKLGEVAKLEPCGIHWDEREAGAADDVVHVVARTSGAHRKYYCRRRDGGTWAPWQPIQLDIEDNPVIPVVWRSRLFLFWLRILKQAPVDPSAQAAGTPPPDPIGELSLAQIKNDAKSSAVANAKVTIQAVLCWSEFLNGKWQSVRTSDIDKPTELGKFAPNGFDRSKLRLSAREEGTGEDNVLRISIGGEGWGSFVLYNTHSAPVRDEDENRQQGSFFFPGTTESRDLDTDGNTFTIHYYRGPLYLASFFNPYRKTRPVFETTIRGRTIATNHPVKNVWEAPFFYEDRRHAFYVTTRERLVRLPQYGGFWEVPSPNTWPGLEIPDLVFERPPLAYPPKGDPWLVQPGEVLLDPLRIGRFVSEDADIHNGLGNSASFSLDGEKIGPAGLLSKSLLPNG